MHDRKPESDRAISCSILSTHPLGSASLQPTSQSSLWKCASQPPDWLTPGPVCSGFYSSEYHSSARQPALWTLSFQKYFNHLFFALLFFPFLFFFPPSVFFFFFFFFSIFIFERERKSASGGEAEREGGTESKAGSRL